MDAAERNVDALRTDLDAHSHVTSMRVRDVVSELVDLLGATSVAVLGGVNETRAVQQWVAGEREPQRQDVLRFACQLATMIVKTGDSEVARSWFQASNPHLDDRTPLLMLRNDPLYEIQRPLMEAARAFARR